MKYENFKIRDGGRPPCWNNRFGHNSTAHCPISVKVFRKRQKFLKCLVAFKFGSWWFTSVSVDDDDVTLVWCARVQCRWHGRSAQHRPSERPAVPPRAVRHSARYRWLWVVHRQPTVPPPVVYRRTALLSRRQCSQRHSVGVATEGPFSLLPSTSVNCL